MFDYGRCIRYTTVWLLAVFIVAAIVGGCENYGPGNPANVVEGGVNSAPVDYGNGVYFFKSVEARFGNELSNFIAKHPELELVSTTGNGRGPYGLDIGYFVVFQPRSPPCGER